MTKGTPTTEQFQHFVSNLRESFWGDVNGTTRLAWQKFWEADSERQRDRFAVVEAYERNEQRRDYRNGYYTRDFVTVLIAATPSNKSLDASGDVSRGRVSKLDSCGDA
jgi:Transposase, Mutator family